MSGVRLGTKAMSAVMIILSIAFQRFVIPGRRMRP
jgi:hypothetical protein